MAALEIFANNPSTTVMAGGTGGPPPQLTNETWTVLSSAGFPSASTGVTQFHIGDPAAPSEVILVYNIVGTTWYVTRGVEGSPTVPHSAGFTVVQIVTAGWLGSITTGSFVNPMTTGGDTIYGAPGGTAARRAGNVTTTKQFLTSTGAGGTANAPVWGTIATSDVPTLNQNTTGTAGSAATAGTAATVSGTIPVIHGGTGLGTFTTYAVVTGGTSSTSPLQQVATAGTIGQVLTSNGPGSLPTWQTPTGGTSGGSSVSFPITVPEGGTGGTQATAYSVVIGGTSSTSPFQQVSSVGGSGQVLSSQGAGLPPTWITNTGGSVTFPITVGEGGSGGTAATAYSVLTGGTTATDAFQAVTAGAGSIGFVLTTTGTSSLPSWQRPTGGTGLSNPMTGVGDMVVGGAGGIAVRLANPGGSGLTLTSNGTGVEPTWQPPPVDWLNVQDPAYGATGNGTNSLATSGASVGAGDGAVTASSKTFTSASLAPFSGSRQIWVPGAGSGGNMLVTTITCTVAGTGTLAVAATTTVTGVVATWGTDDTAAIQRALTAATENVSTANPIGLTVYFPAGIYLVSSPLIVPPGVQLLGSGRSLAYYGGSQPFPISSPVLKPTSGFTHTVIGGGTVSGVIGMISQNLGNYQTNSANQTVRYITVDGRLVTPGTVVRGIEAQGPVWGVKLEDVGIYGTADYGIYGNSSAADGTGKFPDFWQLIGVHVAAAHNDGVNMASISDSYFIGCESTGNSGNGWTLTGDNIKISSCKAEYNAGIGLSLSKSSSSRPVLVNGFGTDGNYTGGIQVNCTSGGGGPFNITGCGLNYDGQNNGAGGNFAGLSVLGSAHVTVSGLQVTTGIGGASNLFPQNGVQVQSGFTGVLQLENCEIYGGTTAISVTAGVTGTVVTGTNVLTGVGDWANKSVTQVWEPAMVPGGALGTVQPVNHSLVAWTFDPALAGNHFTYTSGTQYLCGVYVNQNVTIGHVYWAVGATATTITASQNFVGLYNTAGALMGSTATATIDSTMQTNGLKSAALSAPVSVTPGMYWVGLLFNYSGAASLGIEGGGNGIAGVTNAGLSVPGTYRYAIPPGGTGRTTLLSSFAPASNALSAPSWWAAVDV